MNFPSFTTKGRKCHVHLQPLIVLLGGRDDTSSASSCGLLYRLYEADGGTVATICIARTVDDSVSIKVDVFSI